MTVRELLLEKLGRLCCRHLYQLQIFRGRMFLRCSECGAETEGFTVHASPVPVRTPDVGRPR